MNPQVADGMQCVCVAVPPPSIFGDLRGRRGWESLIEFWGMRERLAAQLRSPRACLQAHVDRAGTLTGLLTQLLMPQLEGSISVLN